MGKNVAVFVDVANIFYAAKAAGVDIDYVTLLKSITAGRDLVRAYAYTGLDPDNENQRNFHDFLRRSNYKVVSKDIRKYGDGKIKANLDIELVVDMMKTARNLDIAIIVSGDGDFAPAIRAVQEQGVRVEVVSFRGNTSSDLIEAADQFTDIIQLARVEKGSRSGRRVAESDDLSMTEVPDKETEGTGVGRGRGMRGGRGRGRVAGETVAAGGSRDRDRGRGRGRTAVAPRDDAAAGVVALPGERLSRAGGLSEADLAAAEVFTLDDLEAPFAGAALDPGSDAPLDLDAVEDDGEDGQRRRRRRRGGRGRGRGRGREDGLTTDDQGAPLDAAAQAEADAVADAIAAGAVEGMDLDFDEDVAEGDAEDDAEHDAERVAAVAAPAIPAAPRGPRTTPFGSVWDSQLGTAAAPSNLGPIAADDEDFDEPEIPEYLIAEQRRGTAARGGRGGGQGGQGGRGVRGGRSAYQSAMDRERFGGRGGGGINRYPDVSGRTGATGTGSGGSGGGRGPVAREDRPLPRRDRDDRPRDAAPRDAAVRPTSSDPWSEVPPELEAMLRAQVGGVTPRPADAGTPTPVETPAEVSPEIPAPRRRSTRKVASSDETTSSGPVTDDASAAQADAAPAVAAPAPKRPTTRKAATPDADAQVASKASDDEAPTRKAKAPARAKAPAKPRASRAATAATAATASTTAAEGAPDGSATPDDGEAAPAAPRRRTTRKAAATSGDVDPT